MKRVLLTRTLRATHMDSHYVAAMFKYMRAFGSKAAKLLARHGFSVLFGALDDKAKVRHCCIKTCCMCDSVGC